jgi:hypothetical protein
MASIDVATRNNGTILCYVSAAVTEATAGLACAPVAFTLPFAMRMKWKQLSNRPKGYDSVYLVLDLSTDPRRASFTKVPEMEDGCGFVGMLGGLKVRLEFSRLYGCGANPMIMLQSNKSYCGNDKVS